VITKLLIDCFLGVPTWLLGVLPSLSMPTFFQGGTGSGTVGGFFSQLVGYFATWDNIFPFDQAGPAVAIVLSSLAIAATIKLARIVASFLTLGGGSAA
jgi:hypothetical protein